MRLKDLSGQTFERLTVLGRAPGRFARPHWVVRCSCGTEKVLSGSQLRPNGTRSCGCLIVEINGPRFRTHGKSRTPANISWRAMRVRCGEPTHHAYKNYGGRGITVCPEWESFEAFHRDMGDRPPGRSLDRIDNNQGYFKENCRWATRSEQAKNRRPFRRSRQ